MQITSLFHYPVLRILLATSPLLLASQVQAEEALEAFPVKDVRLLDGPFKYSQNLGLDYVLRHDPDRLLAPYLREAGLPKKAEPYGNWESSGLDGHSAGHYLSALAYYYAATQDAEAGERLDYMLSELARCQEANGDGYVGGVPGSKEMWAEIRSGDIRANSFGLNGKWVPWYNIHKVFAGLRDAWLVADKEEAHVLLSGLVDWCDVLVADLSDEQIQDMLSSEHGGMVDVLVDYYEATADKTALKLARRFVHHAIVDPLAEDRDELTGKHANTQIPKIIGAAKLGTYEGDPEMKEAALFFWERVVGHRSVSVGGNSVREHFHSENDFTPMIESRQGPESCNTYNMLQLTEVLFDESPSNEYMDYYERALYNHILSLQHPEHGGLVYFTPMRPGHYRVYSQAEKCFWCCVGSGMENPGRYNRMIYSHAEDGIWVNLFIASELDDGEEGFHIRQETEFPAESSVRIIVTADEGLSKTVAIRKPGWTDEKFSVSLDGELLDVAADEDGYIKLDREWSGEHVIEVNYPMHVSWEGLPMSEDYGSFVYGPLVLAAKCGDGELTDLIAGGARMGHVAAGPFANVTSLPVLEGEGESLAESVKVVEGKPLHFQLTGQVYPKSLQHLELEPFHDVHDSRYVIYFRRVDEGGYSELQKQQEEAYASEQALEALMVDRIEVGEQQPEVEHSLKGEGMHNGTNAGEHWREAQQWFGYLLKDSDVEQLKLRLRYFGGDGSRACSVLINGETVGEFRPGWGESDKFLYYEVEIDGSSLPEREDGMLELRLESLDGARTPAIYEIQLLRN